MATSKARVAPIKGRTIPKMEFTSVLITGRLIINVLAAYNEELTISTIHVWSDSQMSPHYVRNRVDEFRIL